MLVDNLEPIIETTEYEESAPVEKPWERYEILKEKIRQNARSTPEYDWQIRGLVETLGV